PRSLFSQKEMTAVKWVLEKLGVQDIPSVDKMRSVRDDITLLLGAQTQTEDGKCGNIFSFNDIETIIQHEWANPLVRPRVRTYPVHRSRRRENACDGDKWADEIDAALAAPMARSSDGQDYFVGEVAVV
ncbi:hypothetical protein EXIGLDRAFT_588198, partial [Exidia glandulosa HHB12029]